MHANKQSGTKPKLVAFLMATNFGHLLSTVFATKVGSFLVFLCGEIGSPSPDLTAKEYVTEKHLFHMMAHVLPGKNL